jgi:acyl-CoA reductase-like NAD-dependent aldehyde dehydrogenase
LAGEALACFVQHADVVVVLGGKAANIVFDDAPLSQAISAALTPSSALVARSS